MVARTDSPYGTTLGKTRRKPRFYCGEPTSPNLPVHAVSILPKYFSDSFKFPSESEGPMGRKYRDRQMKEMAPD